MFPTYMYIFEGVSWLWRVSMELIGMPPSHSDDSRGQLDEPPFIFKGANHDLVYVIFFDLNGISKVTVVA